MNYISLKWNKSERKKSLVDTHVNSLQLLVSHYVFMSVHPTHSRNPPSIKRKKWLRNLPFHFRQSEPGLPDGLFTKPKIPIWFNFGGSRNRKSYDHLVYFTAIGNILRPFGLFCGHLVYFPRFGMLYHEKSGNPDRNSAFSCYITRAQKLLWNSFSNISQVVTWRPKKVKKILRFGYNIGNVHISLRI
jgi:hypothetical protein